jgi:hypothetical protein
VPFPLAGTPRGIRQSPGLPAAADEVGEGMRTLSAQNRSVVGIFGLQPLMGVRRQLSKKKRMLRLSCRTQKPAASRFCYKLLQCNKIPHSRD